MSFNDKPLIDESSKRSEDSVLYVKSILKRKNGFISREESPDYGVDLDVELVTQGNGSSGFKFAVQIKSVKECTIVTKEGKKYISLSFSTSRLGYLMRRVPGYGIITIYSDSTEECYFDYVEDLINRITLQRDNEDWKEQDSVKLNIPYQNTLDVPASAGIYKLMLNRQVNSNSLFHMHGHAYNIPIPLVDESELPDISNINDPEQIKTYLLNSGLELVNSQKFDVLYNLIIRLTFSKINSNIDLLFISALTYSHLGKLTEAQYYLQKCELRKLEFPEDKQAIVDLIRLRVDTLLGRKSLEDYFLEGKKLLGKKLFLSTRISLMINLQYIELKQILIDRDFNEQFENNLTSLIEDITNLDTETKLKYQLLLFHADTVFQYVSSKIAHTINFNRGRRKLGMPITIENDSNETILLNYILNLVQEVSHFSKKNGHDLLMANALLKEAAYFHRLEFNIFLVTKTPNSDAKVSYQPYLNQLLQVYYIFSKNEYSQEAHSTLKNIYDLKLSFFLIYKEKLNGLSLEEIEKMLRDLESDMGLQPFQSTLQRAFDALVDRNPKSDKEIFWELAEEEIPKIAKATLKMQKLPFDRLENIINYYKSLKKFYTRCSRSDIQILQTVNRMQHSPDDYKEPVQYKLKNTKTGIESLSNLNIEYLLDSWNL